MNIDNLFKSVVAHIAGQAEFATLTVSDSWAQGRTLYGGISAAMLFVAMREKVNSQQLLRSLTTNFVGPITAGEAFNIEVEVLRQGKNATQVLAKLIQAQRVAVLAQATFGLPRNSKVEVLNSDTHLMPTPKKASFFPHIPKVTPKFLKQFELCKESGGWPFTAKKMSHIHGFMRFSKPPCEINDAHLIALIDAWPPTVLQMLRWPAPASTMCWNVEFIHPHRQMLPTDWFAYQVETRQAAEGYAHTEANVFDSKGGLVALSRQTVAIFD